MVKIYIIFYLSFNSKYYFIDNGIISLLALDVETSLLENMVAVELMRRYGTDEQVFFYNKTVEVDFYIPDQALIENTPLVEIAGEFQHLDKVVFDFINYANIGAGEYTLISAGSLGEGFSDRISDDIEIRNLTLQNGYTSELEWVNGSNLMLTVSVRPQQ